MYVHLKGAIDIENRFFLSVLESEKAPLRVVPVSTNESGRIMNVETEWNNSVNKSNIEFHDFIFSGLDTISLRTIRSEERQLDDSCIRRQRYSGTPPYGHLVNTGHLVIMAKFFGPVGDCTGCKENHFYSLPFGQAEASIY